MPKQGALSRKEMEDVIKGGRSVMYKGNHYTEVDQLPTEEEIEGDTEEGRMALRDRLLDERAILERRLASLEEGPPRRMAARSEEPEAPRLTTDGEPIPETYPPEEPDVSQFASKAPTRHAAKPGDQPPAETEEARQAHAEALEGRKAAEEAVAARRAAKSETPAEEKPAEGEEEEEEVEEPDPNTGQTRKVRRRRR